MEVLEKLKSAVSSLLHVGDNARVEEEKEEPVSWEASSLVVCAE